MKIERRLSQEGNYNTDLYSLLTQIQEETHLFFNTEHKLREPVAICSLGESRFFVAYIKLLSLLDGQKDCNSIRDEEAFNKTKDVIEAFTSYIDDIYSILKCYCPVNASKYKGLYADKWLEKWDESLTKEFKNSIAFTHIFTKINNEIKHNHGRLTQIYLSSSYGGKCLGFFLQKFNGEAVVPCEDVHPKYNGMSTAFSYNWFLYEILGQFYFLSRCAMKTLVRVIYKQHCVQIAPQFIEMNSDTIINVLDKLHTTVTKVLFEDEYSKPFYQVEMQQSTLIIKTPADKSFKKQFAPQAGRISIQLCFSGDGATRSFTMPYM